MEKGLEIVLLFARRDLRNPLILTAILLRLGWL
jgi:hypothetical protein